jgi:hypothetical protein
VVDGEQLGNPLTSKSAQKLGIQELE